VEPVTKRFRSAAEALDGVLRNGITIAVGGFGLSGNPTGLIEAVRDSGVRDLTIVSNNMGVDGQGLGLLLEAKQVRRVVASYVGENRLCAQQYLDGTLEVEFAPQGSLAERLRAGGAGIAAFYTRSGVGTPLAEGKPTAEFDGVPYVQERAIRPDLALVHAWRADPAGNLRYRLAARNFNPVIATAGEITVADVEQAQGTYFDPDDIHTPSVHIRRMTVSTPREKPIEQRTVREHP
jgi:3-oxoacid CoA-transferase subunit A